jgi:multiple sugar transport system substrate-binding protein
LPQGVDVNALTYDQLAQWGAAIQKATGQRMIGFPAGPKGLIHRFWQGYLYPAYTGTEVAGFKSPEAVKMWQDFKTLWQSVNPASTNYDFMQEPLRSGEVWIAWDHVARLKDVLNEKPDDFIAVPAPAGPKGRAFMPVLAGLGIPKGAPNRAGAEALIDYMLQPDTQINVLRELAFFPVVDVKLPDDLPKGIQMEADAVAKTTGAKDALPSLIPVGLGTKGGEWNKVYNDTFTRIVLRNEDITKVLQEQAQVMQNILNDTKAPCWPPDEKSAGVCQVK